VRDLTDSGFHNNTSSLYNNINDKDFARFKGVRLG